jgi:hypothetical protein
MESHKATASQTIGPEAMRRSGCISRWSTQAPAKPKTTTSLRSMGPTVTSVRVWNAMAAKTGKSERP